MEHSPDLIGGDDHEYAFQMLISHFLEWYRRNIKLKHCFRSMIIISHMVQPTLITFHSQLITWIKVCSEMITIFLLEFHAWSAVI